VRRTITQTRKNSCRSGWTSRVARQPSARSIPSCSKWTPCPTWPARPQSFGMRSPALRSTSSSPRRTFPMASMACTTFTRCSCSVRMWGWARWRRWANLWIERWRRCFFYILYFKTVFISCKTARISVHIRHLCIESECLLIECVSYTVPAF